MNKLLKTGLGFSLLVLLFVFACQNKNKEEETILTGKATILVEDSVFPIVEDQQAVFETQYEAKLTLVNKSETEVVNDLLSSKEKIAVIPRNLTQNELNIFKANHINPRITPFATDAVVFIRNKKVNDTLIALDDVISFMKGSLTSKIKGLVFDNPNSSTVRTISEVCGINVIPQKNIYSFKNSEEVIKYVAQNEGMIGVVGLDWILQPPLSLEPMIQQLHVLSVKSVGKKEFVFPSQDNIAQGYYPLARDLYIINCQGYSGLGMGFASFIGGERGQRIVLKSGLVPIRYPSRKIVTRNRILKEKNN